MAARLSTHTALRRVPRPAAPELALASGPRPEAIVALLAAALVLMTFPALVAGLSMLDSNLLAGVRGWVQEAFAWLSYLAHARLVLTLPLALIVAQSKEG